MGSGCATSHQTSGHLLDCEFQQGLRSVPCRAASAASTWLTGVLHAHLLRNEVLGLGHCTRPRSRCY